MTRRVRVHNFNDPQPEQPVTTVPLDQFYNLWQKAARFDLKWLNTGSVWRPLPSRFDLHPTRGAIATDCVVVFEVTNGFVRTQDILPEGVARSPSWESPRIYDFMQQHARVWPSATWQNPDDPRELWPDVLVRCQLMSPQDLPEPEPEPPKRKRKRKPKARKPRVRKATKTRWERMLDDDDF